MKKNILFLLAIILSTSTIFISCSSDDDDDNEGVTKLGSAELYVNNIKWNLMYDGLTSIDFTQGGTYTKSHLDFQFYSETEGEYFSMSFRGLKLENIKAGDDLTKYEYTYMTTYKKDSYLLVSGDTNKDGFNGYGGQVIVKEYDKDKRILKVEFSNVTLPIYNISTGIPSNTKTIRVKGSTKFTIELD